MAERVWDEATLLRTLPKDISIELSPDENGGWVAYISGLPELRASAPTEEEAESRAFAQLGDLMRARRELARKKCEGR
jgi:hypothetical protein